MTSFNAGKITRFEDGSTMSVTPAGGSAADLLNIIGGTMVDTPAVRQTLAVDIDRGNIVGPPRAGDEQPGTLSLDVKHTASGGATELVELLDKEGNDGMIPTMGIVIKIPDFAGATVGVSYTYTDCYRLEPLTRNAGTEFDTLNLRLGYLTRTKADYGGT